MNHTHFKQLLETKQKPVKSNSGSYNIEVVEPFGPAVHYRSKVSRHFSIHLNEKVS